MDEATVGLVATAILFCGIPFVAVTIAFFTERAQRRQQQA